MTVDKPLTQRTPDANAETQAYAYAYGKRAAQDIGEAFLCGVEYQKRRQDAAAPAMLAALKAIESRVAGDRGPTELITSPIRKIAREAIASAEGR